MSTSFGDEYGMNQGILLIMEQLERRASLQSLSPLHPWDERLEQQIEDLKQEAAGTPMITFIAALHLLNDSLDLSHSYAQLIEHDPTGAYWHWIMHRMEGDYSNAKYWFRQAGNHPVMAQTKSLVAAWLEQNEHYMLADTKIRRTIDSFKQNNAWDSMTFTDLIQHGLRSNPDSRLEELLKHIQAIEIQALFRYTVDALEHS